jgi:hypothetical protein
VVLYRMIILEQRDDSHHSNSNRPTSGVNVVTSDLV